MSEISINRFKSKSLRFVIKSTIITFVTNLGINRKIKPISALLAFPDTSSLFLWEYMFFRSGYTYIFGFRLLFCRFLFGLLLGHIFHILFPYSLFYFFPSFISIPTPTSVLLNSLGALRLYINSWHNKNLCYN